MYHKTTFLTEVSNYNKYLFSLIIVNMTNEIGSCLNQSEDRHRSNFSHELSSLCVCSCVQGVLKFLFLNLVSTGVLRCRTNFLFLFCDISTFQNYVGNFSKSTVGERNHQSETKQKHKQTFDFFKILISHL